MLKGWGGEKTRVNLWLKRDEGEGRNEAEGGTKKGESKREERSAARRAAPTEGGSLWIKRSRSGSKKIVVR